MTELQKRVSVSVVFIPVLLAALYFGGVPLIVMFALVTLLGGHELIQMHRSAGIPCGWQWLPVGLAAYLGLVFVRGQDLVLIWVLFGLALLEGLVNWQEQKSLKVPVFSLFGVIYTAVLPAMLTRLGIDHSGSKSLFWLIILIWSADTAAYFVGMALGKRRNLVAVSPNKSLEGFIAGALVPFVIVFILSVASPGRFDLSLFLLAAFAAGMIGQLGDLAESMIKRSCNVKDSSKLIPGHGGILDRTDSILLAGSFMYCALSILEKVR